MTKSLQESSNDEQFEPVLKRIALTGHQEATRLSNLTCAESHAIKGMNLLSNASTQNLHLIRVAKLLKQLPKGDNEPFIVLLFCQS